MERVRDHSDKRTGKENVEKEAWMLTCHFSNDISIWIAECDFLSTAVSL